MPENRSNHLTTNQAPGPSRPKRKRSGSMLLVLVLAAGSLMALGIAIGFFQFSETRAPQPAPSETRVVLDSGTASNSLPKATAEPTAVNQPAPQVSPELEQPDPASGGDPLEEGPCPPHSFGPAPPRLAVSEETLQLAPVTYSGRSVLHNCSQELTEWIISSEAPISLPTFGGMLVEGEQIELEFPINPQLVPAGPFVLSIVAERVGHSVVVEVSGAKI